MISKILRKIYQTKLPSIFTSEFHSWFFLWFLVFGWQSYSNKHLLSEQCMCLTHDKLLSCWKCHCIFELIFVALFINLISHDARDSGPYERCAVMHIRGKGALRHRHTTILHIVKLQWYWEHIYKNIGSFKTSLLRRLQAQTLLVATPPIGKIHQLSNIAIRGCSQMMSCTKGGDGQLIAHSASMS